MNGEVESLFEGNTPQLGVIRLESWPEGYALWYHGECVWKSWEPSNARNHEIRFLRRELEAERLISNKLRDVLMNYASLQPPPPILISKELATELNIK